MQAIPSSAYLVTLPKDSKGHKRLIYSPVENDRPDRWLWVDTASNKLLILESRIANPWEYPVRLMIGKEQTSSKQGQRERHPIRCKFLIFEPQGDEVHAQIEREIYTSTYAWHDGDCLASRHFPWTKIEGRPQVWLSYCFFKK